MADEFVLPFSNKTAPFPVTVSAILLSLKKSRIAIAISFAAPDFGVKNLLHLLKI